MKNNWKTATIILFVLTIGLISFNIYKEQTMVYDFGTIQISKVDFDKLVNSFNSNPFKICSFENNECVEVTKMGGR